MGDGVRLRPLSMEHAAAFHEAAVESSEELSGTVPWWRPEMTAADHAAWIGIAVTAWAEDRLYAFAIETARGAVLGGCSLEGMDRQRSAANLSYWVRSSATGRGVARTAARLLSEWGIRTLGLHRVEISMVTTNAASQAAAVGSGAVPEGVLRNKARWDGRSRDMAVFSFVPTDFDRQPT